MVLSRIFGRPSVLLSNLKQASQALSFLYKFAPILSIALALILRSAKKRWMKQCSRVWMQKEDPWLQIAVCLFSSIFTAPI